MGDRAMDACLQEMLDYARDSMTGRDLQTWYDEGCQGIDPEEMTQLERFTWAWGYLQGVADALDMTVMEMLDAHGLSMEDKPATKRQKIRKIGH